MINGDLVQEKQLTFVNVAEFNLKVGQQYFVVVAVNVKNIFESVLVDSYQN